MARGWLVLVLLAGPAHAAVLRGGESMRPELVAKTLASVEDEWRKQAALFTEGSPAAAKEAPGAFSKSCATVVSAVIQGSGGDRDVAKEYMNNVCSQKVLADWHKLRCTSLATSITEHAMLADSYANRQNLSPQKVCSGYWSVFVEAEKHREAEEAKLRAEQEKKRAEEEKIAAAAKAEAMKKAEAEAKVEAERRAKEKAKKDQVEKEEKAKKDAVEAKARAAEAAKKFAEKKAEAEKMQKEAKAKMEEAETAEKEHKARLEEHKKAEENLHKATKSVEVKPAANSSAPVANSTQVLVAAPAALAPKLVVKKVEKVASNTEVVKPVAKAVVAAVAPKKVDAPVKVDAKKAATSFIEIVHRYEKGE